MEADFWRMLVCLWGGGEGIRRGRVYTDCTSSTDFETTEAGKGCGADGYIGSEASDYGYG